MDVMSRIDQALQRAVNDAAAGDGPPRLAAAVRHALFPGGARIRPRLCLAVAHACGDDDPALSDAAAAAIELIHCASLVHDDLPCFDDAPMRRGQPSVHAAFDERLAVLAGDALIVLAFQAVGVAGARFPQRLPRVLGTIARGVGAPAGIIAGQAWECEPRVSLDEYQRAKTGALFAAATMVGADAAGADSKPWQALGQWLGQAYQVADDILDVVADPARLGKPVGRDHVLHRPSAAREQGLSGAVRSFQHLVDRAIASIPACPREAHFRALVRMEAERLVPATLCTDLLRLAA
jgi:geranylgeranyl diphosphate synthase, type II